VRQIYYIENSKYVGPDLKQVIPGAQGDGARARWSPVMMQKELEMQETREGKDHQMNHSRASQLGLIDP
jgi:hypothetical protein